MFRHRAALVILFALFSASTGFAQTVLSLNPDSCFGNSVLPTTYQMWQSQPRWMGVAVAPQNPTQQVNLEIMSGVSATNLVSYDPPVVSQLIGATNFVVKNFAGLSGQYVFAAASTTDSGNLAHVMNWSSGIHTLNPGPVGQTLDYGGIAQECGLLRVFTVFLEAGVNYQFHLTRGNSDDLKMALLGSGSLPDGWVARSDAFWEKAADPTGSPVAQSFTPVVTDNYALAVFMDDVNAAGGQFQVRFDEYVPPVNEPDLVVTGIEPVTTQEGQAFQATVYLANQGGVAAGGCVTSISLDGIEICGSVTTPSINPGGTAFVTCTLPTQSAGPHVISAFVDADSTVVEGDETNNGLTQALNVTSGPLPDLTVIGVQPMSVIPGSGHTTRITVRNIGSVSAPATTTRYEVDGGLHTLLISTPALAPSQSVVITGNVPALAEGVYPVAVVADHYTAVTEGYETNNTFNFNLFAEGPNLIIESFSPNAFLDNEPMTFDITVRNIGSAAAGETWAKLAFPGSGPDAIAMTPPLGTGNSVVVQATINQPPDPGTYEVTVCADYDYRETETVETDNCLSGPVTRMPTTIIWPDNLALYPTLQSAIDAIAPGGLIRVRGGTYTGEGNRDLNFGGKDFSLVRYDDTEVIIDCQGDPENSHRGFLFNSGETNAALVDGLTIINGWRDTGNGGGILIDSSEPTIRNCVIRDCHADEGGAISFYAPADYYHPYLQYCTLVGNAANFGDAIYASGEIGPIVENTLIAENSGFYGAIVCGGSLGSPHFTLTCCDIWSNGGGDWVECIAGMNGVDGNFSEDPKFCDPGADDYHIAENSPCAPLINPACGQIGALPTGCGFKGLTIHHVEADGSGDYATIQHAINNSEGGDIVQLGDGIYTGTGNRDVDPLGKNIIIRSASGDPAACRIDAQNSYRGFNIHNGEGPGTVITGIGVINGSAATGGGITCVGSSPTLDNLYIGDCVATDDGGGIHLIDYASPEIRDCVIENNSATDDGGGLFARNFSSPVISGSTFIGNLTGDRGAGANFSVNCFPEIDDCLFQGNEGVNGGGLTFVYAFGPVTNSIFFDNTASFGGGFYGHGNAQCSFTACTFNGNTAPDGANIYVRNNSDPTFDHCIVSFGVTGAGFARLADDCTPTLTCTDVHGNALGDWTAMISDQLGINGNFNGDPMFCDRAGGNFTLRGDSPCALVNNTECGQIGALPVGCTGSWLVRPDGTGDFATIQEAIDAAVAGETVVLADGTFTGPGNRDLDFKGKAITVTSIRNDPTTCIIDCQGSSSSPHFGVNFISGETSASVMEWITIMNGWRNTGGGGRIDGSSPTLYGMIFLNNEAGDSGGGLILANGATPMIQQTRFEGNTSPNAGGGMYINASFPQIIVCGFYGNSAFWGGGGIYNQHAGPNILRCVFKNNTSDHWGGAIHNRYIDSAPNVTETIFEGNSAPMGGAVYTRDASTPSFTECTFYGNSSNNGAEIHARSGSFINVIRCILSFGVLGAPVSGDGTETVNLYCSNVYGHGDGEYTGPIAGQLGINDNISADPVYCDPYLGSFTLGSTSPCTSINSACGFVIGALDQGCQVTDVDDSVLGLPSRLALLPNVPNPFNPMTVIHYELPAHGLVSLSVYDINGRRICDLVHEEQGAGPHEFTWLAKDEHGRELASGLYFTRLSWEGETQVQKIMLIR